jgi:ABC-type phosphate/phosphonate transport system permease subunit
MTVILMIVVVVISSEQISGWAGTRIIGEER